MCIGVCALLPRIPDLGSTCHMIQGSTRNAVLSDNLDYTGNYSEEKQIGAYVSYSRVRAPEGLRILQEFAPFVFQQGPPFGPSLLMRKLRGEVSAEEAKEIYMEKDSAGTDSEEEGSASRDPLK